MTKISARAKCPTHSMSLCLTTEELVPSLEHTPRLKAIGHVFHRGTCELTL